MRRLLAIAGLVAATVPIGMPAASALPECSIQANHTDSTPHGFTAAVNCPAGVDMEFCQASAVVVHATGVRSDPEQTTQGPGECVNSYSTEMKTDTLPLSGFRHIEAKFNFISNTPVSLSWGGDTVRETLVCLGGNIVNQYICFADSTPYFQ